MVWIWICYFILLVFDRVFCSILFYAVLYIIDFLFSLMMIIIIIMMMIIIMICLLEINRRRKRGENSGKRRERRRSRRGDLLLLYALENHSNAYIAIGLYEVANGGWNILDHLEEQLNTQPCLRITFMKLQKYHRNVCSIAFCY